MSLSVTRLKRKSLVKGKEESATQRMERQKFVRSVMEQRMSKMEDTTLTEDIRDDKGKVTGQKPTSQAFELARAQMVAAGGWDLGKIAPVTKENILAFKKFVNIVSIFEQDLGIDHPQTQYLLRKLQNHSLTLFPRAITIEAKDINIVERTSELDDLLKRIGLGQLGGGNVKVASGLEDKAQEAAAED